MKPTHLKTLSARIDEIHFLLSVDRITTFRAYDLIFNYNDFLKQHLTLSQFVPCDENGTPLEVPIGKTPKRSIWEPYNKAQQNVIFEGWEVVKGVQGNVYTNKNFFLYVNNRGFFITTVSSYDIHFFSGSTLIKTISDLAAATIENPLKLK